MISPGARKINRSRCRSRIASGGTPGKTAKTILIERAYLDGRLVAGEIYTIRQIGDIIGAKTITWGGGVDGLLLSLAIRRSPLKLVELPGYKLRVEAR